MAAGTAIVNILGGERVLGVSPASMAEWGWMILEGIPVQSADALRKTMALPEAVLAQLLGVSERTLFMARAGTGRLGSLASHRLFCIARIVALAILVLETDQAAIEWLMHPQVALGVRSPVGLLKTEAGRSVVEKLLLQVGRGARAQSGTDGERFAWRPAAK